MTHIDESTRARLLANLPVRDLRLDLAGVPTAVLEGGSGLPMLLLHGPGEFAATWLPVLEPLLRTYRVIAPDLPGHGASAMPDGGPAAGQVLRWLSELIARTCPEPPVLVGRVVGGAIGARFAIEEPGRLAHLVLVDTLGLVPFEPAPRFGLALHRFLAQPNEHTYERLMDLCAYDLDAARGSLGSRWAAYAQYAVSLAGAPATQAALGALLAQFGGPIPAADLDRLALPTSLIWGQEDLATPVAVARAASARYGWPLRVIAEAGDDPPLDQPAAFVAALDELVGLAAVAR